MTSYMNNPTAAQILSNAYIATPLAVELVIGFDNQPGAIRFCDQVLEMSDGLDEDGYPFPGYAYSWGYVTQTGYVDVSGHQWADTPDDARAAISKWLRLLALFGPTYTPARLA